MVSLKGLTFDSFRTKPKEKVGAIEVNGPGRFHFIDNVVEDFQVGEGFIKTDDNVGVSLKLHRNRFVNNDSQCALLQQRSGEVEVKGNYVFKNEKSESALCLRKTFVRMRDNHFEANFFVIASDALGQNSESSVLHSERNRYIGNVGAVRLRNCCSTFQYDIFQGNINSGITSSGGKIVSRLSKFEGNKEGAITAFRTCTEAVGNKFVNNAGGIKVIASLLISKKNMYRENRVPNNVISNDIFNGGAIGVGFSGYFQIPGGEVIYTPGGRIELYEDNFRNNSAQRRGGAVHAVSATVVISKTTFIGNDATEGGALYCDRSVCTVEGSTFGANEAMNTDGGDDIFLERSVLPLCDYGFYRDVVLFNTLSVVRRQCEKWP